MPRFITFYQSFNPDVECVGSDSMFRFDQRYSNETAKRKVLDGVYPRPTNCVGFAITEGTILNHRIVGCPIIFLK